MFIYIYYCIHVYIVWGTVLVAHNLKHSTLKRCTNIYCVIDFAVKPPADLAYNFRLLSSCGSHLIPLPSPHSPTSYSSAWPAFWSAYLLNAFAVCACVCECARNTNIKFHTAGIKKDTSLLETRLGRVQADADWNRNFSLKCASFFVCLYCFKTLRVTF